MELRSRTSSPPCVKVTLKSRKRPSSRSPVPPEVSHAQVRDDGRAAGIDAPALARLGLGAPRVGGVAVAVAARATVAAAPRGRRTTTGPLGPYSASSSWGSRPPPWPPLARGEGHLVRRPRQRRRRRSRSRRTRPRSRPASASRASRRPRPRRGGSRTACGRRRAAGVSAASPFAAAARAHRAAGSARPPDRVARAPASRAAAGVPGSPAAAAPRRSSRHSRRRRATPWRSPSPTASTSQTGTLQQSKVTVEAIVEATVEATEDATAVDADARLRTIVFPCHLAFRAHAPASSCAVSLTSLLASASFGCADVGRRHASPVTYSLTAKQNYEKGMAELKDENYAEAKKYFQFVKQKFPFSKYAVLAELAIADSQFVAGELHRGHRQLQDASRACTRRTRRSRTATSRSGSARATSRTCPTTSGSCRPRTRRISRR